MKKYLYLDELNQQVGPVSKDELLALKQEGVVSSQTYIWSEELPKWMPFDDVFPPAGKSLDSRPVWEDASTQQQRKTVQPQTQEELDDESPSLMQKLQHISPGMRYIVLSGVMVVLGFGAGYMVKGFVMGDDNISEYSEGSSSKSGKKKTNKKRALVDSASSMNEAQQKLQKMGIPVVDYESRLFEAAQRGNAELMELLITAGVQVNTTEQRAKGREATPLSEAAFMGHPECVKLLLAVPDIDVNLCNPVYWAAVKGKAACLRLLVRAEGINPDVVCRDWTPLYAAVNQGHHDCVEILLKQDGVDVNRLITGYTALHCAASNGDNRMMQLLLQHPDIDVNAKNSSNQSPLGRALWNQSTIPQALLDDSRVIIGRDEVSQASRCTPEVQAAVLDVIISSPSRCTPEVRAMMKKQNASGRY